METQIRIHWGWLLKFPVGAVWNAALKDILEEHLGSVGRL